MLAPAPGTAHIPRRIKSSREQSVFGFKLAIDYTLAAAMADVGSIVSERFGTRKPSETTLWEITPDKLAFSGVRVIRHFGRLTRKP